MKLCRLFLSILLALSMVLPSAHSQEWYEADNPHFLNTQTIFPAIQTHNSIKVIKFFSPWCKYCRFIKAYVQNWKNSHQVSSNMLFYDFNCQQNGAMFCAEHFQVRAYPSVIFVNEKGETMSRIDGVYPEDVVFSILDQYHDMAKSLKSKEASEDHKQKHNAQVPVKEKSQQQKVETTKQVKETEKEVKEKVQQEVKQKIQENNKNLEKEKQVQQKNKESIPEKPQGKQKEPDIVPQKVLQKQSQSTPKPEQQPAKSSTTTLKISSQKISPQVFSQPTPTINPSDISSESQIPQQQSQTRESTSPSIFKYMLYFCGAGIGLLYAYRIYIAKSEQHGHDHESVHSGQEQSRPIPAANAVVTHRDIQREILVQEIMDENL